MRTVVNSETAPELVTYERKQGALQLTINHGFELEVKHDDIGIVYEQTGNTWTLPLGTVGRSLIIDRIVSEQYPHDKMDAVHNNLISYWRAKERLAANPDDEAAQILLEKHKDAPEVFDNLEDWRNYAKQAADDAIAYLQQKIDASHAITDINDKDFWWKFIEIIDV